MNIQEAYDGFIDRMAMKKMSPNTIKAYRNAFFALADHVGSTVDCKHLTPRDIEKFVTVTLRKNYSRSTGNLYAVAIKGFLKHLLARDLLPDWTPANLALAEEHLTALRAKKVKRLVRTPKDDDIQAIRSAAATSALPSPINERNPALVETLYSTGCRIDEVVRLRVKDIDLKNREAIVKGKGQRERKVFFSPQAVNTCLHYWRQRGDIRQDDPVFARHDDGAGKKVLKPLTTQGARNAVLQLRDAAGLDKFTPHSFRHYFATKLLEETGQLDIVQEALGHSSPETTRVYAQTNPEIVRTAHKEVFGR